MKKLKTNIPWLEELLPEGMQVPSSTLISGPGGTGKPLVEFAFVDAWLKAGGSLIGVPLQYPSGEMVRIAMNKLYGTDLKNYNGKIAYIQFEPFTNRSIIVNDDTVRANLLNPEIWDEAIEKAESLVDKTDLGTMVFGSALNLLLFSNTFKKSILEKLKNILQNDKSRTYAFAVSTSAMADEIKTLEEVADNLMFTRMEKPMKLFLKIERMKGVEFSNEEKEVPISAELLKEINEIAEATRKTRIPEIRKI
ncbi:RecA-superfamily ATPase, KaiC/GvpD/RAD55 family [Tangfeifania diversioriginum]|uniref:RecA-superfamily ATPase, KaiC/GvpD/RAD55 family n=1 Tax=Tangfeifania diversioriginum TaxID=1168035 RepID=A0A1M6MTX9_9BACT|nr:ATPase domain-containing protein [Tangfeifania diversioriginum]SHJ86917.1 RecA-superfamily ATPase, KaiC/GvpD/RAD55 family [Tangfeifania diversioriginum]